MYRKYMHAKDKKTNPLPIAEDFRTAAAVGFATMGIGMGLAAANILSKNTNSPNPNNLTLRKSKGGRFTPKDAIKKAEAIFIKTLNKPTYREIKAEYSADGNEQCDPGELTYYNNLLAIVGLFYFHAARSETEEKYLIELLNKFVDDINNQFHKLDKTYSFEKYYEDGYWWVRFINDLK